MDNNQHAKLGIYTSNISLLHIPNVRKQSEQMQTVESTRFCVRKRKVLIHRVNVNDFHNFILLFINFKERSILHKSPVPTHNFLPAFCMCCFSRQMDFIRKYNCFIQRSKRFVFVLNFQHYFCSVWTYLLQQIKNLFILLIYSYLQGGVIQETTGIV